MGLKEKLVNQGSSLSELDGKTSSQMPGANPQSRLHYEYSINGNPPFNGSKPSPSTLDLNGKTPAKYTDNLPG